MFAKGNFENTISIYLLMCTLEFSFCRGLVSSDTSIISYQEDEIIDQGKLSTQKYGMLLDLIPKNVE